eukprot:NODE_2158_length_1265_cov_11.779438_g2052_i0.p1 GENE.NODE_2158_length_1265_cov_11.779438_g2052_i0~~NODE_2158_length_1265_cov_11.779438_g2052_i0.p1  ORF type:complete len:351 (+),score=73.44 NODE_2158_length_1265_cov_11.779438_g2052_i0:62-1114(+)
MDHGNSYNYIVDAPNHIQPVPLGNEEVVSFEFPPAVEYSHHFKTIQELNAYCQSLASIPIQRPSENFIFTEAADNYHSTDPQCAYCGRLFPLRMSSLDRGRHTFKICPDRPVRCQRTNQRMPAKEFLYLRMWQPTFTHSSSTSPFHQVAPPVPEPSNPRSQNHSSKYEQSRQAVMTTNAQLWEEATEAMARREQLALLELEQRALLREREMEMLRFKEMEEKIAALEREHEVREELKNERAARLAAERESARAREAARVWEEATDFLAKREQELLRERYSVEETNKPHRRQPESFDSKSRPWQQPSPETNKPHRRQPESFDSKSRPWQQPSPESATPVRIYDHDYGPTNR